MLLLYLFVLLDSNYIGLYLFIFMFEYINIFYIIRIYKNIRIYIFVLMRLMTHTGSENFF